MGPEQEVLDTNDRFYRAIRTGDLGEMEQLWAHHRHASCTHPNWRTIVGRHGIMESWRLILIENAPPEVWPSDPMVLVTGGSAMVLCTETLGTTALLAANGFVRGRAGWRILSHQAAHVPVARTS